MVFITSFRFCSRADQSIFNSDKLPEASIKTCHGRAIAPGLSFSRNETGWIAICQKNDFTADQNHFFST
jgi:allantoicase